MKKIVFVVLTMFFMFAGVGFTGDWEDEYSYDGFQKNLKEMKYNSCKTSCIDMLGLAKRICRNDHYYKYEDNEYDMCVDRAQNEYHRCVYDCRAEYRMD